jgi:hypothetical protein
VGLGSFPRGWLAETVAVDPECSCGLSGAPFDFHDPGCDRSRCPCVDEEALVVVEGAVESLVWLRGSGPGDADALLWALASLMAGAAARLPGAVAAARDQDYGWTQIVSRVAVTASRAGRRYWRYARWRGGPPGLGD